MNRSVAEHQNAVRQLLADTLVWSAQTVALGETVDRVLAGDVVAALDLPPFDNSQMDGYAVSAAALESADAAVALSVAHPIAAGSDPAPLAPGTAAPIMTGAMLPAGADTVVPIEAASPDTFFPTVDRTVDGTVDGTGAAGADRTGAAPANAAPEVLLPGRYPAGRYIRAAGSDIAAGTVALAAGTVLGPAQLGLLAALGLPEVRVRRRPTVLLLSTGDEVVAPGGTLGAGQIYDANTTLLTAALEQAGASVRATELLADSPVHFRQRLAQELAAGDVDLVLSSGGISKGAYEVVRQGLAAHRVQFHSVAMQPGGPQAIGSIDGIPFLGFPGNPVSSLVSFEMFLRPALTAVIGFPAPRAEVAAALTAPVDSPGRKYQLRRGQYRAGDGTVTLVGGPGSHLVSALAASNVLVHLPDGIEHVDAGQTVRAWML